MTRIVVSTLAAAALVTGFALLGAAPASSQAGAPAVQTARGMPVTPPAERVATIRETTARGAFTATPTPLLDPRERSARGATTGR